MLPIGGRPIRNPGDYRDLEREFPFAHSPLEGVYMARTAGIIIASTDLDHESYGAPNRFMRALQRLKTWCCPSRCEGRVRNLTKWWFLNTFLATVLEYFLRFAPTKHWRGVRGAQVRGVILVHAIELSAIEGVAPRQHFVHEIPSLELFRGVWSKICVTRLWVCAHGCASGKCHYSASMEA